MSALLELQERIEQVGATLGQLEQSLKRRPSASLIANMSSLRNYRIALEQEFAEEVRDRREDVCSYRIFSDRDFISVAALSSALGKFQRALSVTFDAVNKGKSDTAPAQFGSDPVEMGIAYTFPGSFGAVLTLSNEQMSLDIPSALDAAVDAVFAIAEAKTSTTVAGIARSIGRAPVKAMFGWAKGHADNNTGADIDWHKGADIRHRLMRQPEQIATLCDTLHATGEEREETNVVHGILVGADVRSHRFHFIDATSGDSIKGTFSDAISAAQSAILPQKYLATIRKTTKVQMSMETEDVKYWLLKLDPMIG